MAQAALWPMTIVRADGATPHFPIQVVPTDFPGTLYVPADNRPHPAVLLLHGLEGGAAPDRLREAQVLASQGFAAFAYCWFGCDSPGVPATPQGIDLSRTYEAFRWLRNSPYVHKRPTAFYGVGRGAEQALVLGVYLAKHPEYCTPNAIVAHAPPVRITTGEAGAPPVWNWGGELASLQPGTPIDLDRYSGEIFITQGLADQQQSPDASHDFEKRLREAGTAVRTYLHDRDPAKPPLLVVPSPGPSRAEFHYFEGEGFVFDPAMDSVRMNWLIGFLMSELGS